MRFMLKRYVPICSPLKSKRQCDTGTKQFDVEKVAAAIEADAGEALPDLRQVLVEAKAGLGRVTTPERIIVRHAREKSGFTQSAFAERIATPVAALRAR